MRDSVKQREYYTHNEKNGRKVNAIIFNMEMI